MSQDEQRHSREEFLICLLANMLTDVRSAATGAASPIPVAATLLASLKSNGKMTPMILGSNIFGPFNDGGPELFDRAAQGRIDIFIMGGGQIDGSGNINLVGTGNYPLSKTRFPGSFGTPYLYSLVPRVILFREEHSERVLVPEVDFVSAAGSGPEGAYRPGGPYALVTERAVFRYDRDAHKFILKNTHFGNTLANIREKTGFEFDVSSSLEESLAPTPDELTLLRGYVSTQLREIYPEFASRILGSQGANNQRSKI
jgi:glutaconate CoA-transferase subunit B